MKQCDTCRLRGYSRELCALHSRHCRKDAGVEPTVSGPVRISAAMAGGVAIGISAGLLLATAASFIGGDALFQTLLVKLVAGSGLIGGGWGVARAVCEARRREPRARSERRRQGSASDDFAMPPGLIRINPVRRTATDVGPDTCMSIERQKPGGMS